MQTARSISDPVTDDPVSAALSAVPLFHAAWLFAGGIAVARAIWIVPSHVLGGIVLAAVLCAMAAVRAQRIAWLPVALFWLLLGAWCAEMEPQPAPAPALAALSDGLLRTVEGTVIDAGPWRSETEQSVDETGADALTQRIDLRVASVEVVNEAEDGQRAADGAVRLTVRWPVGAPAAQPFQCGERIRAVARLLPPETYHDPGVWSREDFLLDQGITSTASLRIDRVERLGAPPGRFLPCRITGLQHATSARLLALPAQMRHMPAALRLSEDDAVMLAAMITGDRTYLTHSLRVGFERTGSFHMLVVSGFHLAIVAGCILWTARRLRLPRVPATLVTIAASFAYALFTGFATPVQRSLWMVTLYLIGRLIYRERNAMNTIGFASLCLLAASPRSLFESSLQMTLLAVLSIGGIAAPLLRATIHPYLTATRDLRLIALDVKLAPGLAQFRVLLRMLAAQLQAAIAGPLAGRIAWGFFPAAVRVALRIAELLVVSVVVELAMAMPMAVYFHRITLFALPVNLLVFPLLLVLMPAALLVLAALALWPQAAVVPGMAVAALLHFGVGLVRLFGSFALGDFRIPAPLLWQCGAFCVSLGAAIAMAHLALHSGFDWPRRAAWLALILAAASAVIPRSLQHPNNALLVEAIDVGQGDSLLLITPDGKTLLVDGGGHGGGPQQAPQEFDIGEEVVSEALWSRGIRRLDVVALSHAHSDHMGGLPAILSNFRPAEFWVGNNPRYGPYDALLNEATALHVRVRAFRTGDELTLGAMQIAVLAPFRDYKPGEAPGNNDSLVLRAEYGETSVLLEGDAEDPVEERMVAEPGLQSSLLKVGHHGSITSTRPAFLAAVSPQWAVISCGIRNRFGHPRSEVLDGLQATHVRTLRTDIHGASCFALDGKTVALEPWCGGQQGR
jgi:competence protein ComEC